MKDQNRMFERFSSIQDTITRFPITAILLFSATITNGMSIHFYNEEQYSRLFLSLLLASALSVLGQMIFERFFQKASMRWAIYLIALIVSGCYYVVIRNTEWEQPVIIRTIVIFFIILIAILWIPVIKSSHNFNESFLAIWKGFFTSLAFSGVLYIGVVLIIQAIDLLFTNVSGDSYSHTANIIFVLLAPIYLLSYIPVYPGAHSPMISILGEEETQVSNQVPSKFLETLISYVMIPLAAVFSIILLAYIMINIMGDFWTDNLMEPMLLSYSIAVIVIYLLSSTVNNKITNMFRKIFPKLLVPIVLFQTVSSTLRIGEEGVTSGRYFVIIFGVFSTVAGIIFSFCPTQKNGLIAPILIVLSLISIIPPFDAFTVGYRNQRNRLEKALIRNNMLEGDTIHPNSKVDEEDRNIIINSVQYLRVNNDLRRIEWLHEYEKTYNFEGTFGFAEYQYSLPDYKNINLIRNTYEPILLEGYDVLLRITVNVGNNRYTLDGNMLTDLGYFFEIQGDTMDEQEIVIFQDRQNELIRFPVKDIMKQFTDTNSADKYILSNDEMTVLKENSKSMIKIIFNTISLSEWNEGIEGSIDANILIRIKDLN